MAEYHPNPLQLPQDAFAARLETYGALLLTAAPIACKFIIGSVTRLARTVEDGQFDN